MYKKAGQPFGCPAELVCLENGHNSAAVYRSIRFGFGGVTNLPFPKGDDIVLGGYRIARKIFKFN